MDMEKNARGQLRGRAGAAPDWGAAHGISELWTEIVPGLWVGGTADNDIVTIPRRTAPNGYPAGGDASITKEDFDSVCTLYAWARPADWGVLELRAPFYDGVIQAEHDDVRSSAIDWVVEQVSAGRKTLVRCQAGLNRSSFVAAAAMLELGLADNADSAISTIRRQRSPRCLFNAALVKELHRIDNERKTA